MRGRRSAARGSGRWSRRSGTGRRRARRPGRPRSRTHRWRRSEDDLAVDLDVGRAHGRGVGHEDPGLAGADRLDRRWVRRHHARPADRRRQVQHDVLVGPGRDLTMVGLLDAVVAREVDLVLARGSRGRARAPAPAWTPDSTVSPSIVTSTSPPAPPGRWRPGRQLRPAAVRAADPPAALDGHPATPMSARRTRQPHENPHDNPPLRRVTSSEGDHDGRGVSRTPPGPGSDEIPGQRPGGWSGASESRGTRGYG